MNAHQRRVRKRLRDRFYRDLFKALDEPTSCLKLEIPPHSHNGITVQRAKLALDRLNAITRYQSDLLDSITYALQTRPITRESLEKAKKEVPNI